MARDFKLCASVGAWLLLLLASVALLYTGASFYRDYSRELAYHTVENERVRKNWYYTCGDDREQLPREIASTCQLWRTHIDNYRTVGVRNVALGSAIDTWLAWYMHGIGTRLLQMGYNIVFMLLVALVCLGVFMFGLALLLTRAATLFAQSNNALPGAPQHGFFGATTYLTAERTPALPPPTVQLIGDDCDAYANDTRKTQ